MDTVAPIKHSHNPILKSLRDILIEFFISFAHTVFFWLPTDEMKGNALLLLHGSLGVFMFILFFLFPPRHIGRFIILILFNIVLISQIMFNGCIVTRAEHRLTGEKKTLFDYVIQIFGLEPTNKLRMFTTFTVFCPALSVLLLSFLSDFIWTHTSYITI